MKKIAFYGMLLFLTVVTSSCRYDEGPYVSFVNPEERLVGYWKVDAVYKNGERLDSSDVLPNNVNAYYAFFIERMISVNVLEGTTYYESVYGSWEFQNHEKELMISFVLRNKHYSYTAVIKKLTKKILIYEYYDDKGDKWRLEFYSRSALYYS